MTLGCGAFRYYTQRWSLRYTERGTSRAPGFSLDRPADSRDRRERVKLIMKAPFERGSCQAQFRYFFRSMACTAPLWLAVCLGIEAVHAGAATLEQNWPQWRGPLQNGVAPSADPPVKWSESSNIKWKVKIPGEGSATPLVWGNQVFIQTAIPTGKKGEPQKEESGNSE